MTRATHFSFASCQCACGRLRWKLSHATLGGLLVQVEGVIRDDAGKWDPGLQWSLTGGIRWD